MRGREEGKRKERRRRECLGKLNSMDQPACAVTKEGYTGTNSFLKVHSPLPITGVRPAQRSSAVVFQKKKKR